MFHTSCSVSEEIFILYIHIPSVFYERFIKCCCMELV